MKPRVYKDGPRWYIDLKLPKPHRVSTWQHGMDLANAPKIINAMHRKLADASS